MKTSVYLSNLVLFIALIALGSCEQDEKPPKGGIVFSGTILDYRNNPIVNAELNINGASFKVNEEGKFEAGLDSADRFVVNMSKVGYGFISKIFFSSVKDKTYRLRKATMVSANPGNVIIVTDDQSDCEPRNMLTEDTLNYIRKSVPVLDHRGKVINVGMPDDLFEVFKQYELRDRCNTGATVRIPANALALPSGATGDVTVSISTIDIFSLDGMPGDWSVGGQREATFMVSMGAATVDVFYEGQPVDLKKGMKAEIIIPVDPTILETARQIPDSISFLVYNRKTGQWEQEGIGIYEPENMAYRSETSHFSEFNMDIYKVDPACIRFCIEPSLEGLLLSGSDKVEVIMNDADINMVVQSNRIYNSGGTSASGIIGCGMDLHLVYNLSPNTPMVLIITDNAGGNIKSLAVLVTGDPIDGTDLNSNNTVDPPYDACCTPGPGVCEDPCEVGTVPIMDSWSANEPVLFGVKDDGTCTFTLHWFDPNVVGQLNQGVLYTITATEGTNSMNLSGITVSEIEPGSGFYSAVISICAGSSDLACNKNWTITVKHQFNPVSNATCIPLLFVGCSTCTPCP